MNLAKLHNAIKKVCPIHGVSIGKDVTDKTKWQISFKDEATADQRTAAQGIIDAAELSILDDVIEIKYVPCKDIILRLNGIGKYELVKSAMSEVQKDIFFSLKEGIDTQDAEVRALFVACGIDPDLILY